MEGQLPWDQLPPVSLQASPSPVGAESDFLLLPIGCSNRKGVPSPFEYYAVSVVISFNLTCACSSHVANSCKKHSL